MGSVGRCGLAERLQPHRIGAQIKSQRLSITLQRLHIIDRIVDITPGSGDHLSRYGFFAEVESAQTVVNGATFQQVTSGIRHGRYPFQCLNPLPVKERLHKIAKRRSIQGISPLNEPPERVQISHPLIQVVLNQG